MCEVTSPNATPSVRGLVLAAGGGHRLGGRPKALLYHQGRPLVEHAVRALREGGCHHAVHVVLGAQAGQIAERAELAGCVTLENAHWREGMGSSLRAGLDSLADTDADAALIILVDQPGIGARAIQRVCSQPLTPATLAAATYAGQRGHPVLLGAEHWAGVAGDAHGDRGARDYLRTHAASLRLVECSDIADPADIDTPADLDRLQP